MTQRHKHADVLIALAEGKEIECLAVGEWLTGVTRDTNPISMPLLDWRVKPPQWKINLRQAVKNGKTVEWWYEAENKWIPAMLNKHPDDFILGKEHEYRIKPETLPVAWRKIVHRSTGEPYYTYLDSEIKGFDWEPLYSHKLQDLSERDIYVLWEQSKLTDWQTGKEFAEMIISAMKNNVK